MDKDVFRDAIATHLKIVRELAGISPEEASLRLEGNPSPSYIRRLEKGEHSPTIEALAQLCEAYGTTLEKFFTSLPAMNDDAADQPRKKTGTR